MRTTIIIIFIAAAALQAQSFHTIRVIPATITPGSILWCGDQTNQTICTTATSNTGGTLIKIDKSLLVGDGDNAFFTVDSGGGQRIGFTKKTGFVPRLTYGSGNNFELAQSSATDIGAANTYTVRFSLNQTSGSPSFTYSDATTGAIFTQNGAGSAISVNTSNASNAISAANAGSGGGGAFTSSSGDGVLGVSSSASGVNGQTGTGIGVVGLATGALGVGGTFSGIGTLGVGLVAQGASLAAHFSTGNVQIDNSLTVGGSYGLTSGGALTVASCTGCASGGVTSFNSRTGAVTLLASVITSAAQDIQTSASPTFSSLNVSSFLQGFGAGSILGSFSIGTVATGTTFNVNGTGLSSIAAALTVGGAITATGGVTFGSSSNSYFRTFSGAPSCVAVTDGWFGFDTSLGILYICNGGVATVH